MPENRQIVDIFYDLGDRWICHVLPDGRLYYQCLDLKLADLKMEYLGIEMDKRADIQNGLMIMERAAKPELNRE